MDQDGIPIEICGRICKEDKMNLGTVPKVLSDQIEEQGDLDVLKEWIRMAFQSKSVEEFAKKIK